MAKRFNWRKIFGILLLLLSFTLIGMIYFSPFKYHADLGYQAMKHVVEIKVPVDSVFRFLGNSSNASKWSVFVDHISPLNASQVPDGQVGSTRRCFCYANEQGRMWDEKLIEVIPNQKRQITIYNLKEFSMQADHLATEQLYYPTGPNSCRLAFTVFFKDHNPSWWVILKTHLASYIIMDIFERNMNNIRRIVETGS